MIPAWPATAGSTSAARRSRPRSSTRTVRCSAPRGARRRRAAGRRTSPPRWRRRCARRPSGRGGAGELAGIGVGSPGHRSKTARSPARATCPAGKAPSRWRATLAELARPRGQARQRRAGRDDRRGRARRRAAVCTRCSACSGAPASAAARCSNGSPWRGRGGAGEIGHMVVEIDGARCTCGRRGCMEAYAGRAAMEAARRASSSEKGEKTDLFKLMKQHGRDAADERRSGRARSSKTTSWRCG